MLWPKWAVPHPQMYTYIIQNFKISRAAKIVRKKKLVYFKTYSKIATTKVECQRHKAGPGVEPAGQRQKCPDRPMSEQRVSTKGPLVLNMQEKEFLPSRGS